MSTIAFVIIDISADAAFCIAAPEMAMAFDRPVAAHPGDGTAVVPVTGLVGSLRAHVATESSEVADKLFGRLPLGDDKGFDSVVRGLGATLSLHGKAVQSRSLERRSQTAIDRRRGAAAAMMPRQSQAVPAGASVCMYLEVRDPAQLDAVVEAARHWMPSLGGARTSGLGQARVVGIRHGTLDTRTTEGLQLIIEKGGPELVEAVATVAADPVERQPIVMRDYAFEVASPLFVRGERVGNRTQSLHRGGRPHVDGSSWKGVFRSGAQFVVDSAAGADGVPSGCAAVDALFGTTERRGALAFSETVIAQSSTSQRVHVAIDRVSGGARDERLFIDDPVDRGQVHLRITAARGLPDWVGVLLDCIVADIHDGYLGVGGATSRGYGTLRLLGPKPRQHTLREHLQQIIDGEGL